MLAVCHNKNCLLLFFLAKIATGSNMVKDRAVYPRNTYLKRGMPRNGVIIRQHPTYKKHARNDQFSFLIKKGIEMRMRRM